MMKNNEKNAVTITIKGDFVPELERLREKTGIPISQMVALILRGYTIIEISTGEDLLVKIKNQIEKRKIEKKFNDGK